MATAGQRDAQPAPGPPARLLRAFRALSREQRLCAAAAVVLLVAMFLPWYDQTLASKGQTVRISDSAFGSFSVVEANVLIFSLGVLALLFARGERRPVRMPGGDGSVIAAAGGWLVLVLVIRMFDKEGTSHGQVVDSTSLDWGIFVALFAAAWLAYSGRSLLLGGRRPAAAQPPPAPAPGQPAYVPERRLRPLTPAAQQAARDTRRREAERPARPRSDGDQLAFELPHDQYDE